MASPLAMAAGFATVSALAGATYYTVSIAKVFGGSIPSTLNEEWVTANLAYRKACPREGAPDKPIFLNPIRNGYKPV